MSKNRVIPFGYCMKNGEITVDYTESKAVIEIFEEYLNGSSLKQIAKLMESEKIRYTADSEHWNKNMVKRIIENKKYLGNDKYPQIISGIFLYRQTKSVLKKQLLYALFLRICRKSETSHIVPNAVINFQESAVTVAMQNGIVVILTVTGWNINLRIK